MLLGLYLLAFHAFLAIRLNYWQHLTQPLSLYQQTNLAYLHLYVTLNLKKEQTSFGTGPYYTLAF